MEGSRSMLTLRLPAKGSASTRAVNVFKGPVFNQKTPFVCFLTFKVLVRKPML